jgi:D-lyxose ketol-isomerase
MKRSEINYYMRESIKFLDESKFYLPKFAFWSLDEWKSKGEEVQEIIKNQLGWDITDYGQGDFSKIGLIHFTIRNGNLEEIEKGGKGYCEKVMILEEGQKLPMHFHFKKGEDIINRAGGILLVQVYNPTEDNNLADTLVTVSVDGVKVTVDAGGSIALAPGESIYLPPLLFHRFWIREGTGKTLIGEVSSVNDDKRDNFYLGEVGRFPEVDEDEEPLHILCSDYEKFLEL